MTFQVANGSIPEVVERFLHDRIKVEYSPFLSEKWALLVYSGVGTDGFRTCVETMYFDWSRDHPPSLQEAIEAVMARDET